MQFEARVDTERCQQSRYEVAVQLYHVQCATAADQRLGQRALSRADFHQVLCALRLYRCSDAIDNRGIVQKILSEAFAGAVLWLGSSHVRHCTGCDALLYGGLVHWSRILLHSALPYDHSYRLAFPFMPFLQYLRLVDTMARMALRADAARYFLGYIWWILEPLLWVGVFYLVFMTILDARQGDFLIFLAVGKLAFVWFAKSVTQASNSIINGKGLVGKVSVPMTLFPMSSIQEGLYRQVAVFALLAVFLLNEGYQITSTWWYLLPVIIVNYLMIVACAFVGACLVCIARDFSQLISLGVMFLMFTSGVFWDVRTLEDPAKTQMILDLNPLAFVLDAYRQIMMHNTPPDMLHLLIIGAGFGAMICAMVLVMRGGSQYLALKALTA